MTMTINEPEFETSDPDETIAGLLGEVGRESAGRALHILIQHIEMLAIEAETAAGEPVSEDPAALENNGAAQAYNQVCVYLRGLVTGVDLSARAATS